MERAASRESIKGHGCKSGGAARKAAGLEICAVSFGTEAIARWSDRGAEVSRGRRRLACRLKARTVPRKGIEGQGK